MSNFGSFPTDLTTVLTNIATVDTVVDEINAAKLTKEDKSFVGIAGPPVLYDDFMTVAEGAAPDANVWTITEDAGASVLVNFLGTNLAACVITAGNAPTLNGIMETMNHLYWGLADNSIIALHSKTRAIWSANTGEWALGLVSQQTVASADLMDGLLHQSCIHCDGGVVNASSGDGVGVENTVITGHAGAGAYHEYEIIITPGVSVVFIVDGAERATHVIRVPGQVVKHAIAAKNTNAIQTTGYIDNSKVWNQVA